jgi:TLP18.3/Psb32/MOLO-1 phosphatase superfamily protein/uncharacterized protein DUF5916/cellulose/xylan binding protein with CBM9 domain
MKNHSLFKLTKHSIALMLLSTFLASPLGIRAETSLLGKSRPAGHVNDVAGIIDEATARRMESILINLQERTGIDFVVVTVKTVGAKDLYDCSVDLAHDWNVGSSTSRQMSLLLLLASDSGKFFTQASPLAQELVPGLIGHMGRQMRPEFQASNYGRGLLTGIETFVNTLGARLNFSFTDLDRQPSQSALAKSAPTVETAPFKPVDSRPAQVSDFQAEAKPGHVRQTQERNLSPANTVARNELHVKRALSESEATRPTVVARSAPGGNPIAVPSAKALPIQIPRIKTGPVIDGRLDDGIWKQAVILKDFYQVQPGDNIAASQPTEVLLGYDEKFLYIAFHAYDDPNKVRATITGRDHIDDDDRVGVVLDTFNDQRKAYQLFFNPLGVQADAVLTEGEGADSSVDLVMESKGAITADGYVVEVAIPFKSLRYEAGEGKAWGVHFQRRIKHLNDEVDSWMPISRDRSSYLSQGGHLTGIENISQARTLEVIPTLTVSERGRRTLAEVSNPAQPDATRFVNQPLSFQPGLTMKFGIRPNVTAALTINPDFADIEADRTVITANQRFPIFFEEKRPFFLEGIEVFRTPLQAVHTRAIVDPDLAAKLTGKVGRNTFGLLIASDAAPGNFSNDERNNPINNAKIARFIDKNAYVGVLRLQRDLGRESSLGMLATSYNFIEKHNQLGGLDGRFRLDPQSVISFQVLGTTSRRSFYDPDLDKSVYRTGNGLGYSVSYEKSQRHFYFGLNGRGRTSDYRADLGFTRRTNTNSENVYLSYSSEPKPDAKLISWSVSNSLEANFDWQGRSQSWDNYSELQLNFPYQTYFNVSFDRGYERLFENEFGASRGPTRDGAFFGNDPERAAYQKQISFSGGTTPGKKYSAYAFFGWNWGAFDYDFGAEPRFPRVSPAALSDPDAALDPGPGNSSDASLYFTFQPTPAWRTSVSYNRRKLVRRDTGRVAFSDQIYSLNSDYRFTRFLFARVRVDYDWLSSNVLGQVLVGWTPKPGTAVYAGYNDYLNYNGINPLTNRFEPGLRRNERVFFLKMSYLLRKSLD